MKKAIITDNLSGHNFGIGDKVEVISTHDTYYFCKGETEACYFINTNELELTDD